MLVVGYGDFISVIIIDIIIIGVGGNGIFVGSFLFLYLGSA